MDNLMLFQVPFLLHFSIFYIPIPSLLKKELTTKIPARHVEDLWKHTAYTPLPPPPSPNKRALRNPVYISGIIALGWEHVAEIWFHKNHQPVF